MTDAMTRMLHRASVRAGGDPVYLGHDDMGLGREPSYYQKAAAGALPTSYKGESSAEIRERMTAPRRPVRNTFQNESGEALAEAFRKTRTTRPLDSGGKSVKRQGWLAGKFSKMLSEKLRSQRFTMSIAEIAEIAEASKIVLLEDQPRPTQFFALLDRRSEQPAAAPELGRLRWSLTAASVQEIYLLEPPKSRAVWALIPASVQELPEVERDPLAISLARSGLDAGFVAEQLYAGAWLVRRDWTTEDGDREMDFDIAANDQEAMNALLGLAGMLPGDLKAMQLDAMEDGWSDITDPDSLARRLTETREDETFEALTGRVPIPLRESVQRQLEGS